MKNNVLIVENERATAFALSEGLAEDGYSIKAVPSSEAALRFLKGRKCDLIITDISLPGINGIELLKRVSARRKIPSIVITACGSQDAADAAKEAGAVKFFSKPFKVDEVKRSVAQALISRAPAATTRSSEPSTVRSASRTNGSDPAKSRSRR